MAKDRSGRGGLEGLTGTPKLGTVSRLWTPRGGNAAADERASEGVPLVKLIKRKLAHEPELVMISAMRSIAAERFRRLKTLLANAKDGGPQVMVITSAGPGEGKSFVAINLALAFAADGQGDVLLIDADLRRPTVDGWVSPPPKLGLAELLADKTELDHTVLELQNSPLKILPAGSPPPDPVELLSSARARDLVPELRSRFRRVIIDTPPCVPFTDADAVGALADGFLLVARAGTTRRAAYLQAISSVTACPVLGTVLNELTFSLADRDSYHSYERGYHEYYAKEREKKKP